MEFYDVQARVFGEYDLNGFFAFFDGAKNKTLADLAELGLIVTEIAEAMELVRDNDYSVKMDFELADIVIRVLNFASRKEINIERAILEKDDINKNRPEKHGREAI